MNNSHVNLNDIEVNNSSLSRSKSQSSLVDKDDSCYQCIGACGIVLLALTIITGIVLLTVYDIIALKSVSAADISDKCEGSGAWYFVLVSLILCYVQVGVSKNDKNGYTGLMIPLAMLIWGSIEMWSIECVDDIKGTEIYTMMKVHVILSYIGFTITFVFSICKCYMEYKELT